MRFSNRPIEYIIRISLRNKGGLGVWIMLHVRKADYPKNAKASLKSYQVKICNLCRVKIFSIPRLDIPFIFLLVTVNKCGFILDSFVLIILYIQCTGILSPSNFFSESTYNSFCPQLYLSHCVQNKVRCGAVYQCVSS